MISNMRGDHSVDKYHPPLSTSSIIPTIGAITTGSGSPIQMKSTKGRIIDQIDNYLAILPKL